MQKQGPKIDQKNDYQIVENDPKFVATCAKNDPTWESQGVSTNNFFVNFANMGSPGSRTQPEHRFSTFLMEDNEIKDQRRLHNSL